MCFVLREVSVSDAGNSAPVVWTSKVAGSNKPAKTRPLALFTAKEDVELERQERTALRTISGTVTITCGTVAGQTL